ncbi:MAG: tryptophan synthase subunit alpha [Chromatiales bacterium 21-64-14]|nr:MAG: tryptophan synthase subunit alpha [Chromatiales bacterium 21-64-14]HQU15529.1 tryptophan synthase subunit alpha [Gammaproteobacteria bacterium]
MSRIDAMFATLRSAGRSALIPYITAGDPDPSATVPLLHAMVAAGADLVELGVPFSDPMADGPVIQAACERALGHHVTLSGVLEMVAEFRRDDARTPVVLMGYLNPVEAMGYERFVRAAVQAGVDGVLTVDLPPEEAGGLVRACTEGGLDPIFLVAPTTSRERIARICAVARGFVYYVSLKGVTGAAHLDVQSVTDKVREIRTITSLPVGVGFGIQDAASAARVAAVADAVVVGSALVQRIAKSAHHPDHAAREVALLLGTMRAAMDAERLPVAAGKS